MNALLIPIYEPTDRVLPFLKQFLEGEFDAFLVVDDGSGEKYADIFESIRKETVFTVLSYEGNKGKGYALKTGMKELISKYPNLDTIVTADGDGQHLHEDILKVAEKAKENPFALVLGFVTGPKPRRKALRATSGAPVISGSRPKGRSPIARPDCVPSRATLSIWRSTPMATVSITR